MMIKNNEVSSGDNVSPDGEGVKQEDEDEGY